MSEHPHSKQFPGRARIVDVGPLDEKTQKPLFPAKVHRVFDPETKKFKGTRITVPVGADMTYESKKDPASPSGAPMFDVKVVARPKPPPPEAEALAAPLPGPHAHEEIADEPEGELVVREDVKPG